MKQAIELHIDQLVLDGYTRKEASIVSQSLQRELSNLFDNGDLKNTLKQDYHQRSMRLKSIAIQENTKPVLVGRQIAQSIFNGLTTNNTNHE